MKVVSLHSPREKPKRKETKREKTPEGPAINDKLGFLSSANATEDI